MRIEIEIPKEFGFDYVADKFKDFFSRVLCDMRSGVLCGNYEKETAEMFIKAFAESKPAYDVENVVEQIKKSATDEDGLIVFDGKEPMIWKSKAIEIVIKGGVE